MNNRGQALVEFVLILPVLLMILFVIFDFGTIFSHKSRLEAISSDVVDMYQKGDAIDEIQAVYQDVSIDVRDYKEKYKKFVIKEEVDLVTPGLNRILDDPYSIEIERVIYAS